MDNQSSQDGLVLQLYTEALTQVALVLLTALCSMKSLNNEQPFSFLSFFLNTTQLPHFLFTSDAAHAVWSFANLCATERKKLSQKRKRLRSSILIKAPSTKKGQNHSENKQLPFASQLKNNKSQKWPVAAHLNTHINHKNSYTAPWQCIATVQNFSQGERRQKKTPYYF